MKTALWYRGVALGRRISRAALPIFLFLLSSPVLAANVLIVGDLQYGLVADVAAGIQLSLRSPASEYAVSETKGQLSGVVEREGAQVVVALGMDAVVEALQLPPEIAVVYGLVVVPPDSGRTNVTGVFMSPPVEEYLSMVRRYLPAVTRLAVVGNLAMMRSLLGGDSARIAAYHVDKPADLVDTVNRLAEHTGLLLLPDAGLLTAQVMAHVYLVSFRNNIPLLGISEANVKQGALFALVFDQKAMSRQLGEKVQTILDGYRAGDIPASPPEKYNLYINSTTARKMGIEIPDEMLRQSKKIYR